MAIHVTLAGRHRLITRCGACVPQWALVGTYCIRILFPRALRMTDMPVVVWSATTTLCKKPWDSPSIRTLSLQLGISEVDRSRLRPFSQPLIKRKSEETMIRGQLSDFIYHVMIRRHHR